MKERGIIFGAPMVRALLAGTKRQTRRGVKPPAASIVGDLLEQPKWYLEGDPDRVIRCPYGVPGDRLWVRETFHLDRDFDSDPPSSFDEEDGVIYSADGICRNGPVWPGKTRVSIHMPRWASRVTLEVTEVRVQRLQDISEEDAKAEGLSCLSKDGGQTWKWGIPDRDGWPGQDDEGEHWQKWSLTARGAYARLWDAINGAGSWDANPWIWAISFRRLP